MYGESNFKHVLIKTRIANTVLHKEPGGGGAAFHGIGFYSTNLHFYVNE